MNLRRVWAVLSFLVALTVFGVSCSSSGDDTASAESAGADDTADETADTNGDDDSGAESTDDEDDEDESEAGDGAGTDDEDDDGGASDSGSEFAYDNGDSDYIYDQAALHTFELTLSEEDLAFLDEDPSKEEYVDGAITFNGETLEGVGIRYKGSVGAFVGCLDSPNPLLPAGPKDCTKLSMKVKINRTDDKQLFYGLKKLQFHASNLDRTQMHDRLGYHLFREMGVAAPRASHARVVVNGTFVGLFSLVEQIDGQFTDEFFDDGEGNLYKEVWPTSFGGAGSEVTGAEAIEAGLKTNEKDDPSFAMIESFGSEAVASDLDGARAAVEKWMDVERTMAYAAVDRTIRHDDGPFHYYCFGPCNNHNYYLYEETAANKIHIIPWDLDNAFENIARDANPLTPIADAWGERSNDCQPFEPGPFPVRQISADCDPIIEAWASYEELFEQKQAELIAGPMAAENVDPLLDEWIAQVRPSVVEASELHDDAITIEEWEAALATFREDLDFARAGGR